LDVVADNRGDHSPLPWRGHLDRRARFGRRAPSSAPR
jgi:hypothetical protein